MSTVLLYTGTIAQCPSQHHVSFVIKSRLSSTAPLYPTRSTSTAFHHLHTHYRSSRSSLSLKLAICASSYPGGGSTGVSSSSLLRFLPSSPFTCSLFLLLTPCCAAATALAIGGNKGPSPASWYAGRSSRLTLLTSTPFMPFRLLVSVSSRCVSTACCNRSRMRSYCVWKSKAPPSLNVNFTSTTPVDGVGIPPPCVGCSSAVHTLGPNHGAATWLSCRLNIGAAKLCS